MNEVKHSAGPWDIADHIHNETKERSLAVWQEGGKSVICLVTPKGYETQQDYANAKLIAAAPALEEALTTLVNLHMAEQEGLLSGKPTPQQWFEAVNKASAILQLAKDGTDK